MTKMTTVVTTVPKLRRRILRARRSSTAAAGGAAASGDHDARLRVARLRSGGNRAETANDQTGCAFAAPSTAPAIWKRSKASFAPSLIERARRGHEQVFPILHPEADGDAGLKIFMLKLEALARAAKMHMTENAAG